MEICYACRSLAAAPVRLVRPTHLRPLSNAVRERHAKDDATAYQCETCAGRWYWGFTGSWVLMLPVRNRRGERDYPRWWIWITRAVSRWRASPKMRATRP